MSNRRMKMYKSEREGKSKRSLDSIMFNLRSYSTSLALIRDSSHLYELIT